MKKSYLPQKRNNNFLKRITAAILSATMVLPYLVVDASSNDITVKAGDVKVIYGDINSDGVINILDMISLKSYVTENNTSNFSVKAADLDEDGKVSSSDVVELLMYLLNKIGSFSYENNIDTDGDGLCDYVEKEILKTDYLKKDTDGDGLDDYSEVYLCDTDPLSVDTGKTGIKDSLKDVDGDKLTNAEEITLGTSPLLIDTDEDGLSDYDEVKKYKTDPLKEDTDGDGISDNGEIKLGLDPLKVKSDGKIFDKERTFEQKLSSDNELFKIVNNEDNPYQLSISTKSAGYINEAISVGISAYSNYMQNDAIAGDIVDIYYADDFKIESVKINFSVYENAEKYYIFRYFDDVNMLLPIETSYDGNNVYTECSEDGTYCIVDMDSWISNSAKSEEIQSMNVLYNAAYTSSQSESNSINCIEVYFLMYIKGTSIESARNSVATASRTIIDYCKSSRKNIKIYFATFTGETVVSKETGNSYVSTSSTDDEINEMLSRVGAASGVLDTTDFNFSLTRTLKKNLLEASGINEKSQKYCFVVDVNFQPQSAANVAVVEEMKKNGVDFTFICNDLNDNITNYDALSTNGNHLKWNPDFSENIISKVIGNMITYNVNTGICGKISYDDSQITEQWKDVYEKFYSGKLSIHEIKKLGLPDIDGDETPDCLEIFMKYITFDDNGNILLPTYEELAKDAMKNSSFGLKGLDELADIMKKKGIDIGNLRILPLISNPTVKDSDFDGFDDWIDDNPVNSDSTEIDISNIDDSNIFNNKNYVNSTKNCDEKIEYINLYGSDRIKKPVITYTRYPNLRKRTLIRFEMLYSKCYSDFKITIDSLSKNNYDIYVYPVDGGNSLPIKSTVVSNKFIYEFSTLTNNNGIDKYIPFGMSEESVPKWLISSFTPSWKYYVDIYVTPSNDIFDLDSKNEIKISFEENNWFYAPHGGVATSDIFDYSALYLPDEALEVLAYKNGFDDWNKFKLLDKDTFTRKLREVLTYHFFEEDEGHYLSFGDKGFEYTVISDIATVSTFVGFGCLIGSAAIPLEKIQSILSFLGNTSTTTGAIFTLYSPNNIEKKEFESITDSCLYTVNRNSINIALHNYDKFDSKGERYNCQEWINNGYINKYYYAGASDAYRIIRATDFKPFYSEHTN